MAMRVLRQILLIFCLLGLPLAAAAPVAAAGGGTPAVDASVRETLARGEPADVLILLGAQPDLSPAQALPTKEARGRWVYETLRAAADSGSGPARRGAGAGGRAVPPLLGRQRRPGPIERGSASARAGAAACDARRGEPIRPRRRAAARCGSRSSLSRCAGGYRVGREPGEGALGVEPGLYRPGDRRRRAGHRLRVGSPGADQCVSRLQPRDWHRRPRLQLARQHSRRHRQSQSRRHEPLRLRQPRPVR